MRFCQNLIYLLILYKEKHYIVVKAPHFIHLYANSDVFMRFKIFFVHGLCPGFFFFNSFITVSVLAPGSRAVARTRRQPV
jgi:hypothetical protein